MTLDAAPSAVQTGTTKQPPETSWGLLVVILVAATLVVGLLVTAHRYQPLEASSGLYGGGRYTGGTVLHPDKELQTAFGTEYRVIRPTPRTRFGLQFGLHNEGPLDVQVESLRFPFPVNPPPDVRSFRAASGRTQRLEPMAPFTLRAGGFRDVAVTTRYPHCRRGSTVTHDEGNLEWTSRVGVRYRYLWVFRKTAWIELDRMALSVQGRPACR